MVSFQTTPSLKGVTSDYYLHAGLDPGHLGENPDWLTTVEFQAPYIVLYFAQNFTFECVTSDCILVELSRLHAVL